LSSRSSPPPRRPPEQQTSTPRTTGPRATASTTTRRFLSSPFLCRRIGLLRTDACGAAPDDGVEGGVRRRRRGDAGDWAGDVLRRSAAVPRAVQSLHHYLPAPGKYVVDRQLLCDMMHDRRSAIDAVTFHFLVGSFIPSFNSNYGFTMIFIL
jgi:hypothetical protein